MAYSKKKMEDLLSGKAPTRGAGAKKPINEVMKPSKTKRSMNALDKAISEGKTLPSKNKKYPADTDLKTGKSKGKPVIKIKKK